MDSATYDSRRILFQYWDGNTTGDKPFSDGFVITLIWRLRDTTSDFVTQFAIEDGVTVFKMRSRNGTSWNAWQTIINA